MEKIKLGGILSRKWSDPASLLNITIVGGSALTVASFAAAFTFEKGKYKYLAPVPILTLMGLYEIKHRFTPPAPNQSTYIIFKSPDAKKRWYGRKIPAAKLTSMYLNDEIDFTMDVLSALENFDEFTCYMPSWGALAFLVKQLFPNSHNSTVKDKKTTKREIADHYDRGNDFFNAFLGPRMIYTSAVFESDKDTLETAQDNKMRKICEKLRLKPGERLLDIGCGWGTLAGYANRKFDAKSTGVTLSVEGAAWSREHNVAVEGKGSVEFIVTDYRDIPDSEKFDAVSSVEMAEHVGLANFQLYLEKVKRNLKDDGAFYMQVAGFRKGSDWKDIAWALFMGQYIFPGADASTPLNWYILQLEQAGMEIEHIENVGIHYSLTLNEWYNNWCVNEHKLTATYPLPLLRLWRMFLAWSTVAARRGSATCWMITSHKAIDVFDRSKMIQCGGKWAEKAKFARFKTQK